MTYGEILKAQLATKLTYLSEEINDESAVPLVLTVKELKTSLQIKAFRFLFDNTISVEIEDISSLTDDAYVALELTYDYDGVDMSLFSLSNIDDDWQYRIEYRSVKTNEYKKVYLQAEELIALSRLLHN